MDGTHHMEHSANSADLFSPSELAAFQSSDSKAARAIVVLMLSIFVIGIVLYSIVLYTL